MEEKNVKGITLPSSLLRSLNSHKRPHLMLILTQDEQPMTFYTPTQPADKPPLLSNIHSALKQRNVMFLQRWTPERMNTLLLTHFLLNPYVLPVKQAVLNTASVSELSHLNHWENVDEIQPLDLMRLQAMRTLHLREHRHYFLRQSSAKTKQSALHSSNQPFLYDDSSYFIKTKRTLRSTLASGVTLKRAFRWFMLNLKMFAAVYPE